MKNALFEFVSDDDSIRICNVYNPDEPLYVLRNLPEPEAVLDLLHTQPATADNPLIRTLYQSGVLINDAQGALFERIRTLVDNTDPLVDMHSLSKVVMREVLDSTFTFLGSPFPESELAALAEGPVNREQAKQRHYLIAYSDVSELPELAKQIEKTKRCTVFLVRFTEGQIREIGPMYPVGESFCMGCVVENIERYRVIVETESRDSAPELLANTYLGSLLDYYSYYKTQYSGVHERKMILNGPHIAYTSLITPSSSRCDCTGA
jgi:hypothetical protein